MAALTLGDVLSIARTYVNDDNSTTFTDPVLIPKVKEAHRELQEELWVAGSPAVRAQSVSLAYAANATALAAPPADMLCPTALFENAALSATTAPGWVPMTEVMYFPLGTAKAATLIYWAWQQETIVLLGATVDRAVVVQYRRQIPIPNVAGDSIGILFGESYLAARSAALAAGTLGNADVFAAMSALAKENLAKVISANRGSQKPIMKP